MCKNFSTYEAGSPEYSRLQMLVEEMAEYGLEAKIEDFMLDAGREITSVLYRSYRTGAHGTWVPALTPPARDAIVLGDENEALGNICLIPCKLAVQEEKTFRFDPGLLVMTPSADAALSRTEICIALNRHLHGDWGSVSDPEYNNESLDSGDSQLLSVYHTADGVEFWLVTEHDRSVTTIMLPSDY